MSVRTIRHQRYNALQRYRSPDDPVLIAAKRALELARTEETIRNAIETAPPLDDETVARLHALIPAPTDLERTDIPGGRSNVAA